MLFPQFLNDADPKERQLGLFFGNALMSKCSEVWVFGSRISAGMEAEIESNNYVHLWNYEAFKEKHNAKTKSWDTNGNLINSIIYDVQGDIDMEFTKSLGLKCDYIT